MWILRQRKIRTREREREIGFLRERGKGLIWNDERRLRMAINRAMDACDGSEEVGREVLECHSQIIRLWVSLII